MLTFTGNGMDFSFMSMMDVYSLFGNAVDNAVEAVCGLDDPAQKTIDIKTERVGGMVTVTVTNYFVGILRLRDGLPITSKRVETGYHGLGIKSMRMIAQKYHGDLQFQADGGLFTLIVYLFNETGTL